MTSSFSSTTKLKITYLSKRSSHGCQKLYQEEKPEFITLAVTSSIKDGKSNEIETFFWQCHSELIEE